MKGAKIIDRAVLPDGTPVVAVNAKDAKGLRSWTTNHSEKPDVGFRMFYVHDFDPKDDNVHWVIASDIENLTRNEIEEAVTRRELEEAVAKFIGDEVFAKRFVDCMELIRGKNADYTAGNAAVDRIYNFRKASEEIGLPMKKIWYVYAWKHWTAIRKFVNDSHVESEPIDGRINDVINYMILLGAIVDEEKKG